MSVNLIETLNKIEELRSKTKEQEKAFKEGKLEKAPSITTRELDLMEKMTRNLHSDYSKGRASIQETLTTTDAIKLIPKVIEGKLREAAEPEYLGTKFMQKIKAENAGTVHVIPVVGELVAAEVAEGGRYPEDYVDVNTLENAALEIRVKKIGLKVSITEEAITDSAWDMLGINIRKMGRAMARFKEEWSVTRFSINAA